MFRTMRSCLRKAALVLTGRSLPTHIRMHCQAIELGGPEYGAWTICPDRIATGGVVYSFGVGEDISWDMAMIERFGVTVHAFDPTPRAIEFIKRQHLPDKFVFHEYGVATWDGVARFFPPDNSQWVSHSILEHETTRSRTLEVPVRRFETIMSSLGHSHIDLIKMDIEGAEYSVIEDVLNACPRAGGASQLLVEYHHGSGGKTIADTKASIRKLKKEGFECFYVSKGQREWSFMRPS